MLYCHRQTYRLHNIKSGDYRKYRVTFFPHPIFGSSGTSEVDSELTDRAKFCPGRISTVCQVGTTDIREHGHFPTFSP